ncbi:MAG: 2-amino-4-hydroxy-6-hydroxymethyldihydropteridine diphosphokinase [Campylobacterota bacterium]|nr:2-amino-4-hydroxy-6-hydroxymethyldihydropteridine diphosphokinase [Campylobacterota bacterium]
MPLQRPLDERHRIFIHRCFPHSRQKPTGYRHRVLVGVGGNVGDVQRRLERLWVYLRRTAQIYPIQNGVIVRNPPFGYTQQADFDNTVMEIATSLNPHRLLRRLLRIEKYFGRKRSFANAPRTLDLDMIFFDNQTMNKADLTLPHPGYKERLSVLIPMRSLGPNAQKRRRRYENLDL